MSDWIKWEWTKEKPYPETLETDVYVRWNDGDDDDQVWQVSDWCLRRINFYNPKSSPQYYITHYKVVK